MSVTYTEDRVIPFGETIEPRAEEPFVPRYARIGKTARGGKAKVKTWMILAPIGVVVLGGVVAALVMAPREESLVSPTLSEPAATAPVLSAAPALEARPVPILAEPAPAPAVREPARAPVVRAAPARRAAPASRVASTPRVEAPAVVVQPSPATTTLNTAPTAPAPTPAPIQPPAPQIIVQPLG